MKKTTMTTGTATPANTKGAVPCYFIRPRTWPPATAVGREFQRHAPVKSVPGWLTSASRSTQLDFGSAAWLPLPRIEVLGHPDGLGRVLRFSGHVTAGLLRHGINGAHPVFW